VMALKGYGGTDNWNPDELCNGKIEGNKVSFNLGHPARHAKLIAKVDRLVGDLSDGRMPLKLTLKRVSYPTAEQLRAPLATIDAMVAAELAKRPIGSMTIGVVSGTQLIWWKSYGNADMEKPLPATKDTVYRIGSITKLVAVHGPHVGARSRDCCEGVQRDNAIPGRGRWLGGG